MAQTDPMKAGANQLVNLEIRAGLRPHPNTVPCSKCGHVWRGGERRHEWHHHLGYAREHWASAIVLCTTCHASEHDKAKATHCKHGHEFTPENTITRKGRRGRFCRMCAHLRGVRQAVAAKAARHARGLRNRWTARKEQANG